MLNSRLSIRTSVGNTTRYSSASMGSLANLLQDRIHSTAKVHTLKRTLTPGGGQAPTSPSTPGPTLPQTANAPPHSAIRPAAQQHDIEKHGHRGADPSSNSSNDASINKPGNLPPPATRSSDTKENSTESSTLDRLEKPGLVARARAGSIRFVSHTKDAICHSWINVLLVFVPVGIAVNYAPLPESSKPTIVFAMNAIAIIPLAGLLSHATESVASRMGDTLASLLNVTFGNAVELIIFIIALAKKEIRIVQASILGSILANLLLILGMAFTLGGLRYQEQIYNNTVTQMSACLLSLSVISLLLPTAFHASFSSYTVADDYTLKISRGTCVVLLLIYVLYLLFQLKSHAYMYESTPQQIIDEESHPGVLAEMMNHSSDTDDSSSSSSSSSSSGSDSDSSGSGSRSHISAKRRIKKAFKNRKHRKSVASSTQATSVPSAVSSPIAEETNTHGEDYFELATTGKVTQITSTDANEDHQNGKPRIRDFETGQGDATVSPEHSLGSKVKKHIKKDKKPKRGTKKYKHASDETNTATAVTQSTVPPAVAMGTLPEPPVQEQPTNTPSRLRFGLPQIARPAIRAPLLSNTVFSNPPPVQTPTRGSPAGLRRTNSLPDRLNQPSPGTHQQSMTQDANNQATGAGATVPNIAAAGTGQNDDVAPQMSRTAAVGLLLASTGLVAFCAELLVEAIPEMVNNTSVSQAFIGLIILPIVGNAAEHVTAVTVAAKNKMDLAIGVAVGSSIQIALFITPVVVILGWIMDRDMTLYFNLFETVSLFVTVFVVNFLVLDGRSNYLEGSLLMAAYVIIALAAFFYPNMKEESDIGGGTSYD